jgi:hypothetical protein
VVRLSNNDDGIKDMTRFLFELMEQGMAASGGREGAELAGYVTKGARSFLNDFIQGDLTLALVHPVTETMPDQLPLEVLVGFNTRNRMGTLLGRMLLAGAYGTEGTKLEYRGGTIIKPPASQPKSFPLGWRGTLLLFGSTEDLLKGVMERLDTNQPAAIDLDLQDLLDQIQFSSPPSGQDLAFAVRLRPGLLRQLIKALGKAGDEPDLEKNLLAELAAADLNLDDAQGLTITGDVVNADTIKFEIRLVMARPEVARKVLATLNKAFERPTGSETAPVPGRVSVRTEMRTVGSVVNITVNMTNIRSWLRAGLGVSSPTQASAAPAVTPASSEASTAP